MLVGLWKPIFLLVLLERTGFGFGDWLLVCGELAGTLIAKVFRKLRNGAQSALFLFKVWNG